MKILCATDFSEPAFVATRAAVRLARRFGDQLLLAHVWTSPLTSFPEQVPDLAALERTLRGRGVESLQKIASSLRGEGIEVEERLIEGVAPDAIAELAHAEDVRLVVVGTHGRRTMARAFLGSVAERTMLLCDRPVLVARGDRGVLEGWAAGQRPLRITVGLDRSAPSHAAIEWVGKLRALGPCDVTFVHGYWPIAEYARLGVHGARDPIARDPETEGPIARELETLTANLPGTGEVRLRVLPCWGSAADMVLEEATRAEADLVVVGTHRRGGAARMWLGSTAHPVLRGAKVPVLCVPAAAHHAAAPAQLPRLRNVLVATDLSPLGDAAVAHACALAGPGGSVTICHVHERVLPGPQWAYDDPRDALTPAQRTDLEARLRALVPAEASRRGTVTRVLLVDGGTAARTLNQEANRLGVDAICVASHGRSGLGRALLGSVAEELVRTAERPVLVVRSPRE